MNRIGMLAGAVGVGLAASSHAGTIAATSFENQQAATALYYATHTHSSLLAIGDTVALFNQPDNAATTTADETVIVNSTVAGELAYTATFTRTRPLGGGNVNHSGLSDGDWVGVSALLDDVDSYVDGSQGYRMSGSEGRFNLDFGPVDLSGHTGVEVSLWYFLRSTGYEPDDHLRVIARTDAGDVTLFNSIGSGLEGVAVEDAFTQLAGQIPDAATTMTLHVGFDVNARTEMLYVDDVTITGTAIPEPLAAGAAGALGMVALRRRRG